MLNNVIDIPVTSYNTILLNPNVMFSSSVEEYNQNLIGFAERVINAFSPQYYYPSHSFLCIHSLRYRVTV